MKANENSIYSKILPFSCAAEVQRRLKKEMVLQEKELKKLMPLNYSIESIKSKRCMGIRFNFFLSNLVRLSVLDGFPGACCFLLLSRKGVTFSLCSLIGTGQLGSGGRTEGGDDVHPGAACAERISAEKEEVALERLAQGKTSVLLC